MFSEKATKFDKIYKKNEIIYLVLKCISRVHNIYVAFQNICIRRTFEIIFPTDQETQQDNGEFDRNASFKEKGDSSHQKSYGGHWSFFLLQHLHGYNWYRYSKYFNHLKLKSDSSGYY
jgi:hypothetical protein